MQPFDFNLRHLQAFVATARRGSLSRAAPEVNMSQSAVTQAIAKLERQLGLPLFDRQPSGVAATDAGRLLLPRAETALRTIASNRVTASQVRAFISLSKHGSYVVAAADTGVREPSLHRSVGDLAANLGQQLVERRGRGIAITRRGENAARRFRLAEAELRSALAELEALKGREVGRIVVGAMPLCRARLLPKAIAAFHKLHPKAAVAVVEGSFNDIVGPLRNGDIDLMLGAVRTREADDLEQRPLFIDHPIVVGRAGHPLAGASDPSVEQLAGFPWIIAGEGTPLRQQWRQLFAGRRGGEPDVAVECGSVILARQLLIDGYFLTLLSPDQVAMEIETGLLTAIGAARHEISRTIGMIYRADWRPTAMQQAFIDLVVSEAARMGQED